MSPLMRRNFRWRNCGQKDHGQSDPVSAYMWYLLAEKTAASMHTQIEEGKEEADPDDVSAGIGGS